MQNMTYSYPTRGEIHPLCGAWQVRCEGEVCVCGMTKENYVGATLFYGS